MNVDTPDSFQGPVPEDRAVWIVAGGMAECKARLQLIDVIISGGYFVPQPLAAPGPSDYVLYYCFGGVLDLTESQYEFFGRVVQFPGARVLGGINDPVPVG